MYLHPCWYALQYSIHILAVVCNQRNYEQCNGYTIATAFSFPTRPNCHFFYSNCTHVSMVMACVCVSVLFRFPCTFSRCLSVVVRQLNLTANTIITLFSSIVAVEKEKNCLSFIVKPKSTFQIAIVYFYSLGILFLLSVTLFPFLFPLLP